uniref:Uncharacterized protein n=1 Tax=Kalanchoe fedtschenkoi TaxID=63787 RepID=A0A7N1A7T3_KALFE
MTHFTCKFVQSEQAVQFDAGISSKRWHSANSKIQGSSNLNPVSKVGIELIQVIIPNHWIQWLESLQYLLLLSEVLSLHCSERLKYHRDMCRQK